jgi:ferrous iron transport protein A
MQTLADAKMKQSYLVERVDVTGELKKHLHDLGLVRGSKVALSSLTTSNGIIIVKNVRLAVDREILKNIFVSPLEEESSQWVSLSELENGQMGRVEGILGAGAVKRRLMDMGVTRGVEIMVVKRAPLGDPIQVELRGYQLTMRKSEAELVMVAKLRDI